MPALSQVAIPDAVVPPLTRWGVSPEADLVYRTLTGYGPHLLSELSRTLGLPANRVRNALDELAGLGAARPGTRGGRTDQARTWTGAPAPQVVATLRRRYIDLARARHLLTRNLASLADLGVLLPAGPSDDVRPLYGLARTHGRLAELIAGIRHEHLSMHPDPSFDEENLQAATPLSRALGEREVAVHTLGVPAAPDDATGDYAAEMAASGMHYRELPTLPVKFQIFDRTAALVLIDPTDSGKGVIEVRAAAAVDALVELFLRRWDEAGAAHRGAARTMKLTSREQAIVTLLANGHTDASASAQLGLSVRTIAYTLRGLMDRYGVQNRFQLGLLLGAYAGDQLPAPGALEVPDEPADREQGEASDDPTTEEHE